MSGVDGEAKRGRDDLTPCPEPQRPPDSSWNDSVVTGITLKFHMYVIMGPYKALGKPGCGHDVKLFTFSVGSRVMKHIYSRPNN